MRLRLASSLQLASALIGETGAQQSAAQRRQVAFAKARAACLDGGGYTVE